jgi:hypothetical protein
VVTKERHFSKAAMGDSERCGWTAIIAIGIPKQCVELTTTGILRKSTQT